MKLSELTVGRISILEAHTELIERPQTVLPVGTEVVLTTTPSGLVAHFGQYSSLVRGVRAHDCDLIEQLSARGLPRVCWLLQLFKGDDRHLRLMIQIHELPTSFTWTEATDLGIDERIVEDLGRRLGLRTIEEVTEWLSEYMLLPPAPTSELTRAVLSGRPGSGADAAFRIHGRGYACDVRFAENGALLVTRVAPSDHRDPAPRLLHLALGRLRFRDARIATRVTATARVEIEESVGGTNSYLGLWKRYGKLEADALARRARRLGHMRYTRVDKTSRGYRFTLHRSSADGSTDIETFIDQMLEAATELPAALLEGASILDGPRARRFAARYEGNRNGESVELVVSADQDLEPPAAGFLFLGLQGDRVRLERRRAAWEAIASCNNPMPQLAMLLEGRPVPTRRHRSVEPRSKAVREIMVEPNRNQVEALRVALETPDIALIHGPPGTGKTRVIAALAARLAEEEGQLTLDGFAGSCLLTSFQHDAVENAAAVTSVLGLPAVKIGARHGDTEVHDGVEQWREQVASVVRAQRGPRRESTLWQALTAARRIAVGLLRSSASPCELSRVAQELADVAGRWLPGSVFADLTRLGAPTPEAPRLDSKRLDALKAARGLCTDEAAFAQDGPYSAYLLHHALEGLATFEYPEDERELLGRAIDWNPTNTDVMLGDICIALGKLRERVVAALEPDESPQHEQLHIYEKVFAAVVDALHDRLCDSPSAVEDAIDAWLDTLQLDPEGIRDALAHYTMVLAATCQQAVAPGIRATKGHSEHPHGFRSVVVDEAARANPLDLMIPMSLAQRRIILVGDHRQLPHMLEPEVDHELRDDTEPLTREKLEQSLFQRLFEELRSREKADGIRRVVSLDTQYRMHPALAGFLGDCFYAKEGLALRSVRGPEAFEHQVRLSSGDDLTGRVVAWIDLPLSHGPERRRRSVRRSPEARRIAHEVTAIAQQNHQLSIGVIAFYLDQRDEILRELIDHDISEYDERGSLRVRESWATHQGRERLCVGTVDAFQGKEFDLVFLSLTRANSVAVTDEASRRRRYGFLLLENRLCVALSRQRKLLVVVGDPGLTTSPGARDSVPALVALRELCNGPLGKVIDG